MTLTRIKLQNFTAFAHLDLELSPGVNVLIGENGTGKTHLLKIAYAACDITRTKGPFSAKLERVFLPFDGNMGRLVHRTGKSTAASAAIYGNGTSVRSTFSNHTKLPEKAKIRGKQLWTNAEIRSAFIPVKEMLANAPGFLSLYETREVHFEEVYRDILLRAYAPKLKGPPDGQRKKLLAIIQKAVAGTVTVKNDTFFLRDKHGNLEFTLLAEGMRKLALLWLLIQNGTLLSGSILFWDEPEANLNPKKIGTLVEILLELQRMGVQIMLATHDYVLLKEFDLRTQADDHVKYHALYRDDAQEITHASTSDFQEISPNAITDTFSDLYDREVRNSLKVD